MKIIVTGASDGLGLEICKQLLEKNHIVIGVSKKKPNLDGINYIFSDFRDYNSLDNLILDIKKNHSDFNVIINCAGILDKSSINKLENKNITDLFKVNIEAPIKIISGLIDIIKKNKADIVNVGSTFSFTTDKNVSTYTATKWGLEGFSRNLQFELVNTESRVISFNPGGFQSNLQKKADGKEVDFNKYMPTDKLASLLISIIQLPKCMEVSNIVIKNKLEYHW